MKTIWGRIALSHNDAVKASFYVALTIAGIKAPYTIGESLIKTMCSNVVVSFSNNTIKRQIKELSFDILQQTIAAVKRSEQFSLHRDEKTNTGFLCDTMLLMTISNNLPFVATFPKISRGKKYLKNRFLF